MKQCCKNSGGDKSTRRSSLPGLLRKVWPLFAWGFLVFAGSSGTLRALDESASNRERLARLRDERENRSGAGRMTVEERRTVAQRVAELRIAEAARSRAGKTECLSSTHAPGDVCTARYFSPATKTVLLHDRHPAMYGRSGASPPDNSSAPAPEAAGESRTPEPRRPKPTAKPVPDRPGLVISPFAPEEGYVDVRGLTPGMEVRDPYSGRIFIVP